MAVKKIPGTADASTSALTVAAPERNFKFQCRMRNTIRDVFLSRGYAECPAPVSEEEDEPDPPEWDFIWASRAWIRSRMLDGPPITLRPNHFVNHFPNSFELTRKDLMAKNLMRMHREWRRKGFTFEDIAPVAYVYPNQFDSFVDDLRRNGGVWICKPVAGSMGQGILFVRNEAEAYQFRAQAVKAVEGLEDPDEQYHYVYVVQKYIPNPLLIGGRKFDIRLYALVLSFKPLVAYVYRGGFCRFSSLPYTASFQNREVHLTNVAVQVGSAAYNPRHGGKWDVLCLRSHLSTVYGRERVDAVFAAIHGILMMSLVSVQEAMINDRHCYELYGYDILIDVDLRPWLIEINASPSLDANTETDYDLKWTFLNEMLDLAQMFRRCEMADMPLHYGGYDLAWLGGPLARKDGVLYSTIGCECPVRQAPLNPYRVKESRFRVKKPHPT